MPFSSDLFARKRDHKMYSKDDNTCKNPVLEPQSDKFRKSKPSLGLDSTSDPLLMGTCETNPLSKEEKPPCNGLNGSKCFKETKEDHDNPVKQRKCPVPSPFKLSKGSSNDTNQEQRPKPSCPTSHLNPKWELLKTKAVKLA